MIEADNSTGRSPRAELQDATTGGGALGGRFRK
jgi:hypothetical protein